jgi:hypothetical protein
MDSLRCGQPSLELGVKVVRVVSLDPADHHQLDGGGLFVRYYVPAGDGRRRLRVDTREVGVGGAGDPFWGDLVRFERWGGERGAAAAAPGGSTAGIAFELRWRPRPSSASGLAAALLGAAGARRRRASRVLARAELAWPEDTAAATTERWLALSPAPGPELRGAKAPKLLVEVSTVRAAAAGGEGKGVKRHGCKNECCSAGDRCGQCGWVGSEEDMFLAATFSH